MPRKPRLFYPGAVYHVLLRGNAGQNIFFEDKDQRYFYFLLKEGQEKFGYRIHAFCLMANHIHLAVQVVDIPLSRIMQNLSQRYTGWVNRQQKRTGHIFQRKMGMRDGMGDGDGGRSGNNALYSLAVF